MSYIRQFVFFSSAVLLGGYVAVVWAYPALSHSSLDLKMARTTESGVFQVAPLAVAATSTLSRSIQTLTIKQAIPPTGKFIAADLSRMKMHLYENGALVAEYPILTKGRPGSPYETPSGFYAVLTRERDHLNRREGVHMPYSMQFYGNYFVHGWPYYVDGHPVARDYSGGCIRLSTEDAARVFAFAELKTPLYVYEASTATATPSLRLHFVPTPLISAASYLIADLDSGDVYLDREATVSRPIASITKLMTSLVANEIIMFDKDIGIPSGILHHPATTTTGQTGFFRVGDLLYPLLMESNNMVADQLARYYGTAGFVRWMNSTAISLNMDTTHFADPSGISPQNTSTTEDLYRLARYIANKKSFIFNISRTPQKTLTTASGTRYPFNNFNVFAGSADFLGGKTGQTGAAGKTMLSVFSTPLHGVDRRIAIIILKSDDYTV